MKLLIKNGLIVNADKNIKADILCENGKIVKIAQHLKVTADEIVDATNAYVFPGGIDPHVHLHLPSPAGFSSDDFNSGTIAGIFGGTTCIIDFVTPKKGQTLVSALQERKIEASNSLVDYSFHVSPIEWTSTTEEEIKKCIEIGVTSFKIYMAYKKSIGLDNDDILKVMQAVGKNGGLVTCHCELGDEIEVLRDYYANDEKLSAKYHPLSRPAKLETEAVKRFIEMARMANCPIYIVHVSTKKSLQYIKEAQQIGQKVFAETCPQYLLLDDKKYEGSFEETAPFVMSPPLRKETDNQALWKALEDDTIQTIGTDHCPFTLAQKSFGRGDFRKIPNGAGGIEHRMQLLFTYGVLSKRLTINQFVNKTTTQAAKIFGLYPQKGVIQVGSDADIVIWKPEKEQIISAKTHHQNCDSNIFEGLQTKGYPSYVIFNGEIVKKEDQIVFKNRKASFLKRKITWNS